jgi:hypothetical protein
MEILCNKFKNDKLRLASPLWSSAQADDMYKARFNMAYADIELLHEAAGTYVSLPRTPEISWSFYVRFLFASNCFYKFTRLPTDTYLFVAENKSFPGRDMPAQGEAIGRQLSIAWCQGNLFDSRRTLTEWLHYELCPNHTTRDWTQKRHFGTYINPGMLPPWKHCGRISYLNACIYMFYLMNPGASNL